ncbi:MAG: monofunctional biosynthetic peptidoglycan transglycosylase [Arcicella sp.]|jgi:monofunctional biosynthetic peptidoglycan transglycosylase|nr:monofunctional biosynthetic peptidoglycan transglycosylase [Arcicella sp.]
MAKNTFRTPPPEEFPKNEPNKQNAWQRFMTFRERQPIIRTIFNKIFKYTLYAFITSIVTIFILKFIPVWITPTMIDRKITAIAEGRDSEIHSDWEPYENISKEAALAVVASEDQLFPQHNGFDFKAMWGAFRHNLKGKRIKGASTISQQVAKNVFLWQGRSYIRKILEVYFTFMIELIWGKERILEVYLNVAETGKMTFGVEAASLRFYGHSANSLSRNEAARIAAVLPSPNRFSIANPSGYVQRRTNFIMRQMRGLGGKAYLKF